MTTPFVIPTSYQEKITIAIDFSPLLALATEETLTAVSVVWQDENNNDASVMQDGSPSIASDGVTAQVTKGSNRGTKGLNYHAVFSVTTSTGRILGGDKHGSIQVAIAEDDQ